MGERVSTSNADMKQHFLYSIINIIEGSHVAWDAYHPSIEQWILGPLEHREQDKIYSWDGTHPHPKQRDFKYYSSKSVASSKYLCIKCKTLNRINWAL